MLWQERYGKGSWFVRYESESLVGRDQYDSKEKWTRHNIVDDVLCFIKAYMSFREAPVK
jgi:hypothetical protein